jgi:hypothetical protein
VFLGIAVASPSADLEVELMFIFEIWELGKARYDLPFFEVLDTLRPPAEAVWSLFFTARRAERRSRMLDMF